MAHAIRESPWLFPAIESAHVLAFAFVIGAIMQLDLRLMGLIWRDRPVTDVAAQILPWTWIGFVASVVFGVLMFTSAATKYLSNTPFLLKLSLMALAGLNMVAFHRGVYRRVAGWDRVASPPLRARMAGALSLGLWMTIVAFGRWIGFVE